MSVGYNCHQEQKFKESCIRTQSGSLNCPDCGGLLTEISGDVLGSRSLFKVGFGVGGETEDYIGVQAIDPEEAFEKAKIKIPEKRSINEITRINQ
jgi:hypothetical protein